jgi:hypothetical protein
VPSLATLDPALRPYAEDFFAWVNAWRQYEGLRPLLVTSSRRTWQEQAALFARKGQPGVYTPQPPGRSLHQFGLAWDMDDPSVDPQQDPWLAWAGPMWRSLGGTWGGAQDPVHFGAPRAWWPF